MSPINQAFSERELMAEVGMLRAQVAELTKRVQQLETIRQYREEYVNNFKTGTGQPYRHGGATSVCDNGKTDPGRWGSSTRIPDDVVYTDKIACSGNSWRKIPHKGDIR